MYLGQLISQFEEGWLAKILSLKKTVGKISYMFFIT